jgi:hypothetical protein
MCEDLMDELEVMIPGHRKRLSVAGRWPLLPWMKCSIICKLKCTY